MSAGNGADNTWRSERSTTVRSLKTGIKIDRSKEKYKRFSNPVESSAQGRRKFAFSQVRFARMTQDEPSAQ
jgi:hypothetical protein